MKKKLFHLGMTSALVAGTLFTVAPAQVPAASAAGNDSAPIDLGIVNSDKMIKSLVERGIIAADLTPEQQEAQMNKYLQNRVKNAQSQESKNNKQAQAAAVRKSATAGTISGSATVAPAAQQNWNGAVRTDKILALLVEYSDFDHNKIAPGETDMYYQDYSLQHYKDMLFSPNGYTGPNGKNMISMKQYYIQQSGGSYTVDGNVYGWLKVPHTAAYYGGNVDGSDGNARALIKDALAAAAAQGVDLSQYDQEDPFDLDGDGNTREADGLVDHLSVIHSGMGEEAGGGSIGEDAIWSHRWDLGGVYAIPGSTTSVPYWGGRMGAYGYVVQPEDGATGVFSHEFGHDIGLPDEYDTNYTGLGEPVEYYSIMSSGSWAGLVAGTEPTGFSPYDKEYFQGTIGGNWQHGKQISLKDIPATGLNVTLDQASTKGANNSVVHIDLPDQVHALNTPATGSYEYYGGRGDELDNSMVTNVDLTGATSATLDFDTWYNIESNWDFGFVQVSDDNGATWQSLSSARTTSVIDKDGEERIAANLPGYTGSSNGWVHETLDLSAYAGKNVQLKYQYMTDSGYNLEGFFVDNVQVTKNGAAILKDGAEGTSAFALNGFAKSEGKNTTKQYYLVEWRNHQGVDLGLAHIARGNSVLSYDPGMLVWYVNEAYNDNWVGVHPGAGFLGVVDSHQDVHHWGGNAATGDLASTRYQIFDAAFSLNKGGDLDVDYGQPQHIYNAAKAPNPVFSDKTNYWSPSASHAGLKLPSYGLKIEVTGEAADRSAATIKITK